MSIKKRYYVSKFLNFTTKNGKKLIRIGKVQMLASSRKYLESFLNDIDTISRYKCWLIISIFLMSFLN